LTFTGVTVHGPDLAVVTTVRGDVPDDADITHELVYIHEAGEWSVYDAKDQNIVDATIDGSGDEVALLSSDGFVLRLLTTGTKREEIDSSDDGPSSLVQMRQMRRWPDAEVAVGMARRVYSLRKGEQKWTPIDGECFVPRARRKAAVGFNGFDGWSSSDLVAVGYKGEIWLRRESTWTQLDSPTNVTLMSVACAPNTEIFAAVGLAGVVVIGRANALTVLDREHPWGDLWSVVHFNDSFYFAGDQGVFRLSGPNYRSVEIVKLSSRGKPTAGYLSHGGGVLWSAGDRDMFVTSDAVTWKRVVNP
jgi:hypothetical protein